MNQRRQLSRADRLVAKEIATAQGMTLPDAEELIASIYEGRGRTQRIHEHVPGRDCPDGAGCKYRAEVRGHCR